MSGSLDALANRGAAACCANAAANHDDLKQIRQLREMLESTLNPLMHGSRCEGGRSLKRKRQEQVAVHGSRAATTAQANGF